MARQYPEKDRPELRPDGERPGYCKSSQIIEDGHENYEDRMPHPFRDGYAPNKESGEGK